MRKTVIFKTDDFVRLARRFFLLGLAEEITVGYVNGTTAFPKFEEVRDGVKDHKFAVKVDYQDDQCELHELVDHYLEDLCGRTDGAIYYNDLLDAVQIEIALSEHGKSIADVAIDKLCNFFPAESYYQQLALDLPKQA
ncbi:MAG: peptide-methionine (S)-S-oxide reductase [Bacilli bacterium]|nr:peptide-methionine (S)-S-oxide reductase [Bacilli bacterium]